MQDYINLSLLLFTYGISVIVLVGISILTVNYLSIRAYKIENVNRIHHTKEAEYQKVI